MKLKTILISLCVFAGVLSSCNKDTDDPVEKNGDILITTLLLNPDGMSGSAYIQLVDNLEPKSLTNTNAIPIPFGNAPRICGEDVFVIPGSWGETNTLKKYSRVNNALEEQGTYLLPSQSGATDVVTQGDIAYISCPGIARIIVINHKTMTLVKEIDITSFGIGDQNPDPGSMIIRDNLLFIGLNQVVGGYFPAPERPYSDVLIINTDNNEVIKMITNSISGISSPTRGNAPFTMFMDENEDIYILGMGGLGALPGHNAGLLRIKAGKTEFDASYQFVFNTTPIEGESNPLDYLHTIKYAGNNKLYATANVPVYSSNPPDYIQDRPVVPVEIDIAAKTIKKLNFQRSNMFGVSVGVHEGQVLFGLATETSNGFFTYNPTTETSSSSAVITTVGYPYTFDSFK